MTRGVALPLPKLTVIDLDGTLVDTVPDLAYCTDRMLAGLGYAEVGETRVRGWVGSGLDALIERALAHRIGRAAEPDLVARARASFLDLYAQHTSESSRVYPGVREGLEFLRASGSELACVTNKATAFAEQLLRDLDLFPEFALIVCGDTLATKKPDPAPLLHAAEHLGVAPRECLLIGDSRTDVEAARAANFAIICVTYGYNHGLDIRAAGPDAVIDSLAELEHVLGRAQRDS